MRSPTNGGYTKDPSTYSRMFDYVDTYIEGVKRVDAVIQALSPGTRTYLDETGTDMDGVLGPGAPPANNPRYWVAAAGYWAYMWARAGNESRTVAQVGASQLMDGPGQEPSVSLLDWSTGLGTARFWVVRLVVESFALGDAIAPTAVVAAGGGGGGAPPPLFAMGFAGGAGSRRLLLINKANAYANVTVGCAGGGCACASIKAIDEGTGLGPARSDACPPPGGALTLAPFATAVVALS